MHKDLKIPECNTKQQRRFKNIYICGNHSPEICIKLFKLKQFILPPKRIPEVL